MVTKNKNWGLLLLMFFIVTAGYSQVRRGYSSQPFILSEGLSITPKAGINLFFGDLVDESRNSYSVGLLLDREMTKALSLRANLTGGQMKGTQINPDLQTAFAYFENMYFEFTIGGTYRPLNDLLGYFKERDFQPYVLLQAGLIYYDATEYWGPASIGVHSGEVGDVWREAQEIAPVVGLGGGTTYWISPFLKLNLELYGTLAFSDRLDVHDIWYESWPGGNPHSTDPFDFYYTATVGLAYLFRDSPFRNEPRFNRRSYQKTRTYFQPKSRSRSRPSSHQRNRWLFF
jgi:hypothetical protein